MTRKHAFWSRFQPRTGTRSGYFSLTTLRRRRRRGVLRLRACVREKLQQENGAGGNCNEIINNYGRSFEQLFPPVVLLHHKDGALLSMEPVTR